MFGLLLILLTVSGGAAALSIAFKQKIAYTIPLYFLSVMFIVYCFGLFGLPLVGFYLITFAGLLGAVFAAVKLFMKNSRDDAREFILTPALAIFALMVCFIFIYNRHKTFQLWDEFAHWGFMIRSMFNLDKFFNVPEALEIYHNDYPVGIQMVEYFWCKLAGSYSEGNVLRAIQVLSFSLTLPAFGKYKWGDFLKYIPLVAVVFFLPTALGCNAYYTIYQDAILGLLFAYSAFFILSSEDFTPFALVNLFLCNMLMILTKQMGLVLCGLLLMLIFIRMIIKDRVIGKLKSFKSEKRAIFNPVLALLATGGGLLFGKFSWSLYLKHLNIIGGQFQIGDISVAGFFDTVLGKTQDYRSDVLSNFLNAVLKTPISHFFKISWFGIFIILCAVSVLLFVVYRKTENGRNMLTLLISTPLVLGLYALGMLVLYMFCFSETEGLGLASYDRYMATVLIGIGMTFVLLLSNTEDGAKFKILQNCKWPIIALVICLLMVSPSQYKQYLSMGNIGETLTLTRAKYASRRMSELPVLNNEPIYIIMKQGDGRAFMAVRYYHERQAVNAYNTWDIMNTFETAEEFEKLLKDNKFKYIYIISKPDDVDERFGALFGGTVLDNAFYKVTDVGTLQLIP